MFEFALRPGARGAGPSDLALASALAGACGLDPLCLSGMALVRNKLRELPGERTVERVELTRRGTPVVSAIAKTCAGGRGLRHLLALGALDLPIPRFLAHLPEHGVLLMEEARGERLDDLILAGRGAPAAARAGAAIAAFHRVSPPELERVTLDRLLGGLRPVPAALPGVLGERAAALAAGLAVAADPVGREAVLCHRDLHPRQIFDDGERATIVDLDSVGLGHPALDLANFEVYLRVRERRVAAAITAAFRAGYTAASPESAARRDPEAERIYRAFTYLRLAVKTYRTAPAGWPELVAELVERGLVEIGELGVSELEVSELGVSELGLPARTEGMP